MQNYVRIKQYHKGYRVLKKDIENPQLINSR